MVNKVICYLKQLKWYNRNQVEKIMALKPNSFETISFYFHLSFLQTEVPLFQLSIYLDFYNLRDFQNTFNSTADF